MSEVVLFFGKYLQSPLTSGTPAVKWFGQILMMKYFTKLPLLLFVGKKQVESTGGIHGQGSGLPDAEWLGLAPEDTPRIRILTNLSICKQIWGSTM
jgi:hypothetical protein